MDINRILQVAIRTGASDIHLKAGLPPMFRVNGALHPLRNTPALTPEITASIAGTIMSNAQKAKFRENLDLDLSYSVPKLGRFRVSAFMQRGRVGLVFRVIPTTIKSIEDLNLPSVITKLSDTHRGIVLVTGATGSGKSTTLAAMIDHINRTRAGHIMTVEDPIEFIIPDRRCVINQREIGVDATSFARALKGALRQDPDVILVGEMRDIETVEIALTAAETGHFVMSTLHTVDAAESIGRVISVFPTYQHQQIRMQLSALLKGVVSQRLVPTKDGKGRAPAVEVMVSTAQIRDMILEGAPSKLLRDAIAKGHLNYGSQTFDQSLMSLVRDDYITYEQALAQSTNPDDFALRFSGIASTDGGGWDAFDKKEDGSKDGEDKLSDDDFALELDRY